MQEISKGVFGDDAGDKEDKEGCALSEEDSGAIGKGREAVITSPVTRAITGAGEAGPLPRVSPEGGGGGSAHRRMARSTSARRARLGTPRTHPG